MRLRPVARAVAALCLLSAPIAAQHWSFQTYGAEVGLTNPTVVALHQDAGGYLWAATEGGLYRYDGDRFRAYPLQNGTKKAIPAAIHTTPNGQLWVASMAGLFHWDGRRFQPVPGFENAEMDGNQTLASDADWLYIATPHGLFALAQHGSARFVQLTTRPSAAVFVASDRTVWYDSDRRLCSRIAGKEYQWESAAGAVWIAIAEDREHRIWLRSDARVMAQEIAGGDFRRVPGAQDLSSTRAPQLRTTRDGLVLIPHNAGLTTCRGTDCTRLSVESGMHRAEIASAMEDREGSVWLGYRGYGLARWLGYPEWQSFSDAEGIATPNIWRLARGADGTLWVGTSRGLFRGRKVDGRWRFQFDPVAGVNSIYGLLPEPDGSLWVGPFQADSTGLIHYNPATGRKKSYRISPAAGELHMAVIELTKDDSGTIWMAGGRKLFRLPPGATELEYYPTGLDGGPIMDIRTAGDHIYAGGRKGLYVKHGSFHRLLTVADGLKDNFIQAITVAPDQTIWVAYYAPIGISHIRFEGKVAHVEHFDQSNGLPGNVVYSQFFDATGRHWLTTDSGTAVLENSHWVTYDTSDGLVWNDCNAHAHLAEPDGSLWIGTSAGLARYTPAAREPVHNVRTLISSVVRNDLPAESTDFDATTHSVAVRFTVLSYKRRLIRFRYRIGEAPWSYTRIQEVRFAALPAGSYRFEVQAETSPGEWSEPAVLNFRLRPPWYFTWYVELGVMLAIVGLVWAWWRQRSRREQLIRAQLEAAVAERTKDLAAASARAEQSSRFKGEFVANMSHEMRTPLNGVIGLTELALELTREPEVAKHLRVVQFSAKGLLNLINHVLDFSKIESGHIDMAPLPFAPRPLIANIVSMFEQEAARKGLTIQHSVDASVPEWALADDRHLRQVLVNLVANALKFTTAGSVKVSVRATGSELHFDVADTGVGIPPDKKEIIFDAFRQADNSTSRQHGGTGLGLTISRRLVEAMGGRLTVESELGAGSTFSFSIHAPASKAPAAKLPKTGSVAVAPMRILVAEDNKVNQHLIQALLRRLGHTTTIAENGHQALAALANDSFDVVLMDIQMPEMDGLETVRRIRQREASTGEHIPVIALTARAMMGDREAILAAGMDEYLEKPIQPQRLEAVLALAQRISSTTA